MPRQQRHPVDPNTPGGKLVAARLAADWSQIELAECAGVSRAHVAGLERNSYRGGRNAWEAIAGALGKPLDYFLGDSVSREGSVPPLRYAAKDASEVAWLSFWRDLRPPARAALMNVLLDPTRSLAEGGAIRLSREGDNVIVVQEFSPTRRSGPRKS